jgi:hypothetical protein
MSMFWDVTVSVILRKMIYMNMCSIPNGFRDRAIWMCNYKFFYKKQILRTLSNIYCPNVRFIINFQKFHRQQQCTLQLVWGHVVLLVLSASWLSFIRAITSIMWSSTTLFIQLHKQKSDVVMSGDLGGQVMVLPRPIHRLEKVSLRCCKTSQV